MPLRCLLFSTDEETVRPIFPVLEDLDIEGEFCADCAEAAEKIGTGSYQIVIADWTNQPDAAILLKTAGDQRAAQRPLALAIVEDDSRFQEALRGGANSALVMPLRAQQVHDTLATACELLRSKRVAPPVPAQATSLETAMAAAAGVRAGFRLIPEISGKIDTEKNFRAGEFLQSSSPAPAGHFDTECEIQKSLDHVAACEVDSLTELEPMASAVSEAAESPKTIRDNRDALTGWASLQARLLSPAASPASAETLPGNDLPSFEEARSKGAAAASPKIEAAPVTNSADAPASDFSEETKPERHLVQPGRGGRSLPIGMGVVALIVMALLATPQGRQRLGIAVRKTSTASDNWLNPKPAPLPQAVTQHESFGQGEEEYKLPQSESIPDAATDPSQIQIVPVVDPTAKPITGGEPKIVLSPDDNAPAQSQVPGQSSASSPNSGAGATSGGAGTSTPSLAQPALRQPDVVVQQATTAQRRTGSPIGQNTAAPRVASNDGRGQIPSSLRSQIASMTPEASGAKPMEAAMSAIEPVVLPESAMWILLTQKTEPEYPESAKASGQRGSVTLQVLISRDGTVQDAKFLQGSLIFARTAIDALRQWKFKPYLMNGRPVSVQSAVTLSFKPPA